MSHFALMVIGENHEEQLAPYSEHIETAPRVEGDVSDEEIQRMIYFYKDPKNGGHEYSTFDELYEKHGNSWNENTWEKRNGRWVKITTYNPDSKWDWYEVGGRWTGLLKLKQGVKPIAESNFSSEWSEEEENKVLSENRADIARKGDIENISEIVCFALLKNGKWYERGQMGWGAIVSNENLEWSTKFKKLVAELPDDTLITIVDCHI